MDKKSSYTKQELLDIVKEQWFFKCHFKNYPIMPECLRRCCIESKRSTGWLVRKTGVGQWYGSCIRFFL